MTEARELGLTLPASTPPAATTCEFCGAERPAHGMRSPFDTGAVMMWFTEPRLCDCAKAVRAREDAERAERDAEEREAAEAATRARMARTSRLIALSRIKPRFLTCTFDTYEVDDVNRKAHAIARRWVDTFEKRIAEGRGLYLVGDVDVGKTHLAVAVALALLDRGVPVMVTTTIDLLGEVKRTFTDPTVSEYEVLRAVREVDVLVLDDLGKEPPTEWTLSVLFSIVNDRYESLKPIIATTQYGDDELVRRLSSKGDVKTARAIVSRFHEMCYRVECDGRNRRGKG